MTHVDDFVDDWAAPKYPRWFFFLHRLPAHLKADFAAFIEPVKLFATWQDKRWRVTGASRMGDVWLTKDFASDCGYQQRVDLAECSDWSDKP